MNPFDPEDMREQDTRENDPAGSPNPGPSRESVPDLTNPSGPAQTDTAQTNAGNPEPDQPLFASYAAQPVHYPYQDPYQPFSPQPEQPRLIPHIGHTLLFFLMAIIMIILTEIGATVLYQFLIHGPQSRTGLDHALMAVAGNPVFSIPTQAAAYGLLILISIPVFESLWLESFGAALHWSFHFARKHFWRLAGIGLAAGLIIGSLGNFLPMPKSPPIIKDMMNSTTGAWFMLLFGVTAAPMTEELAFRGFLLPSLINLFRWAERRGFSTKAVTRYMGIPISILLTTIPFALLHATQVSDAWGPLLLIATVSVILCIVRLVTDSVAAGAVVHAAYNFVLFAGVLMQTSGFQHLHKLAS